MCCWYFKLFPGDVWQYAKWIRIIQFNPVSCKCFFFSRKPQLLTPLSQVKNSTFFNPPLILWINIMILLRLAKFNWHVLVSVALKKVSEFLFRLKTSSLSCSMFHQQYLLCLKSIELWSSGTFHQTKLFFAIFLTKKQLAFNLKI